MTTQTWLLTGGAGYIGSHVADEFLASGKDVVVEEKNRRMGDPAFLCVDIGLIKFSIRYQATHSLEASTCNLFEVQDKNSLTNK